MINRLIWWFKFVKDDNIFYVFRCTIGTGLNPKNMCTSSVMVDTLFADRLIDTCFAWLTTTRMFMFVLSWLFYKIHKNIESASPVHHITTPEMSENVNIDLSGEINATTEKKGLQKYVNDVEL